MQNPEEMRTLAELLWNNYFADKVTRTQTEMMRYYTAKVTKAAENGYISVKRPFDETEQVLPCIKSMESVEVGQQVVVVVFGDGKNVANRKVFMLPDGSNLSGGGGSGGNINVPVPGVDFTWTGGDGTLVIIDDGDGKWRMKFLASGDFTPLKDWLIDVFLVGGGGMGQYNSNQGTSYGGGSGYTTTVLSLVLFANTTYPIVVGAGGTSVSAQAGTSSAFGITAAGGFGGTNSASPSAGASGGGQCTVGVSTANYITAGGTNGSNGAMNATPNAGGVGQGTTTREFGEATGDLYASGGNAGCNVTSFIAPLPNTGDGGSAAHRYISSYSNVRYAGASGIVIIRPHKEESAA